MRIHRSLLIVFLGIVSSLDFAWTAPRKVKIHHFEGLNYTRERGIPIEGLIDPHQPQAIHGLLNYEAFGSGFETSAPGAMISPYTNMLFMARTPDFQHELEFKLAGTWNMTDRALDKAMNEAKNASTIILSGHGSPTSLELGRNLVLNPFMMEQLPLKNKLVILDACSTMACSKHMQHPIAVSALKAGARAVVATTADMDGMMSGPLVARSLGLQRLYEKSVGIPYMPYAKLEKFYYSSHFDRMPKAHQKLLGFYKQMRKFERSLQGPNAIVEVLRPH